MDKLANGLGFQYKVVWVDSDKKLRTQFGNRVPVVVVDGNEIAQMKVRETDLRMEILKRMGKENMS
jgi:hypothetical protein